MRDHGRDQWTECPDGEARDALPLLLHGRLDAPTRTRLEAHVAGCADCAAELALLRDVRTVAALEAPPIDVARIEHGVVQATRQAAVRPIATAPARRRMPAFGGLRAAAALLLMAAGSGAVIVARQQGARPAATAAPATVPATAPVAVAPAATPAGAPETPAPAARPAARAAAPLGGAFSDLSDAELAAVIDAVDGADRALPSLDPTPVTPDPRGGTL